MIIIGIGAAHFQMANGIVIINSSVGNSYA